MKLTPEQKQAISANWANCLKFFGNALGAGVIKDVNDSLAVNHSIVSTEQALKLLLEMPDCDCSEAKKGDPEKK